MRHLYLFATSVALWLCTSAPALAGPPPQAVELCTHAPRGCAIRVVDPAREGATTSVTVLGQPQTRVKVMAYQAVADGTTLTALQPLGRGVEVFTGRDGTATADLPVPAAVTQPSSGWLLVSVDGLTGTDVSSTVGTFVPFGARIPTMLGDGHGEAKPVGARLTMRLVGTIRGTRDAVEYQRPHGGWEDVTQGDGRVQGAADEPVGVDYVLPRGLPDAPVKLRLRNRSDSSTSAVWLARPSAEGSPRPRATPFTPPEVGTHLDGTTVVGVHPVSAVRTGAILVASGATAWALGATVVDVVTRRRRTKEAR